MDGYMMVFQFAGMLLTGCVSAIGGWLVSRVQTMRKSASEEKSRDAAVTRVCREVVAAQIDEVLSKSVSKELDNAECTSLLKLWNQYHALGGDGLRTSRVEKAIGMGLEE